MSAEGSVEPALVVADQDLGPDRSRDVLAGVDLDPEFQGQGLVPGGVVEHAVDPDRSLDPRHRVLGGRHRNGSAKANGETEQS